MRISYNKWRRNYIGLLIIKSKDFLGGESIYVYIFKKYDIKLKFYG